MRRNSTVAALLSLALSASALAAPFTPGNLVVLRVGDGAAALANSAAPGFLDEYTPAGVLVQSIALPTVDSGANQTCTLRGSTPIDGQLTRSVDGRFLIGGCYDMPLGTASPEGTAVATFPRVFFRVNSAGVVDTTTYVNNQFNTAAVRSVASLDGGSFWAVGSATGVVTAPYGGNSGTVVSSTVTNNRAVAIFGGQLYASNLSGSNSRIQAVGVGTPTATGTAMTGLPGLPTATSGFNQFHLLDLDAGVTGVDTLYAADDGSAALRKYSLVGGTWTAATTQIDVGGFYRGLTGTLNGTTVRLFATRGTNSANPSNLLVTVTDTAGYGVAPSTTVVSTLATAAANTGFRGVALAPCTISGTVTNGNDSGAGSLRQAIADACPDGTIDFAPAVSTVTLTSDQLSIPRNLSIDGGASGVTVQRSSAGGTPQFRIFDVPAGVTATLRALTVSNGNHPVQAGGIQNSGNLTLQRVTVANNTAPQSGGVQNDVVMTISDSAIVNNSTPGGFGGGIGIFGSSTVLINTTVANNNGGSDGGGIAASGTVTLTNCTITGNTTTSVGAGMTVSGATVTLRNTIVVGNSGSSQIDGNLQVGSANNLIGTPGTGGLTNGVNGNLIGVTAAAAGLGTLGNHGGLTQSVPLLPGSVAIDAGTATSAPTTDQRGIARPQLGAHDIGAFESRGFTLAVGGGSGQSATISTAFAQPLSVQVASANSEPVTGGRVSFTPPGAGASATLATSPAIINASGIASVNATANATAGGPYNVNATAAGAASGVAFSLTNLAPAGVDYCVLQFPAAMSVLGGQNTALFYGRVYEDDNGVLTSAPGAHPSIVAQLGYGPLASNPSGGNPSWTWIPAAFNVQVGNDDEYQASFQAPYVPSTTQYAYTYRFSVDSGATYTYCDLDGNGTNAGLSFSAASLGTLTVNPNGAAPISVNDVSANEGNSGTTSFNFSVTLAGPSTSTITADIATANNTATSASGDYVINSQSLTFTPGQTSKTFTVLVNGDTTPESDETFFVNLTNIVNATPTDAQGQGTIVNDDDPCLAISFPYTLTGVDNAARVANLRTAIQCANLNGTADVIDLNGQSAFLTDAFADYSGATGLPQITSAITLRNGAIARNGAAPQFRIVAMSATADLTLEGINMQGGSLGSLETGGAIFNASGALTLQNSFVTNSSAGFAGAIYHENGALKVVDSVVSSNNSGSGGVITNAQGSVTIIDSTFAGNSHTGTGNSAGVLYNFQGTTTIVGSIFANNSTAGVAGAIHNFVGTVHVANSAFTGNSTPTIGGALFNNNGTITIANSRITGNTAGVRGGGIYSQGPSLAVSNSTIAGNSAPTDGGITITSGAATMANSILWGNGNGNTLTAATVSYSIVQGGFAGTGNLDVDPLFVAPVAFASAPTSTGDYRLQSYSPATDAGNNAAVPVDTLDVNGNANTTEEAPDLAGNPRRYNDTGIVDSGAGTAPIVDIGAFERQTNSVVVAASVAPTNLSLSEAGSTTDSFLVTLSAAPTGNVTVQLSFDGNVQVDTGSGFGASPQTLTLTPANALSGATVNVRAVDDAIDEASPHTSTIVTSATSSPNPGFNGIAVADVTVSISDNDTAGILVTESAGSTGVVEGGAGDSYSVVLLSQPTANVSINITFDPLQASVAGETDGTHSLIFTPADWNLAQPVSVTAVDDLFVENTVHATLIVQTVASGDPVYNVINPADVNVNISENDTRSIVFTSASGSVSETAGTHDIQARLELVANGAPGGSLAETISADVTLTPVTAEAGDLALASTSVAFAGGTSHGAVTLVSLTLANDRSLEGDETATLALALATAPGTVGGPYTLTITDDETATIGFAAPTSNAPEGSTPHPVNATLTVTGSGTGPLQTEGAVSASLNDTPGTAGTPADYTRTTASVSFTAGSASGATQPVLSSIADDALFEVGETYALGFTGVTGAGALGASGSHTVTIVDNDPQPVLSISSPSQNEGNAGTTLMNFVVTLTPASGATTSFTAATANGSATVADNDYVALASTPFTIPAGQTSVTIPVTINGDTVFEGNESFSVNLTGITNATPGTLTGTGTILEDDQQPTTTTITSDLPDPSVVGQPYTVSVTVAAVSTSPAGTVTISDGSASCGPVTLTAATAPNATASCSLTSTTAGAKTLTASYAAATTAFGNSSGTTAHQVDPAGTSISVTGPTRSRINQPTAFTFALSVNAPGAGTPTGTVTLSSGASSCTATLPATSCNLSFTTLGTRTVSASYAGDANFNGSSSSGAGNAQTLVFARSDLSVTKNDGVPTYEPGDLLVYSVIVRNLGPDAAANIRITDAIPAGLGSVVWSCDASGGVACPVSGGAGNLDVTIASFPVGGLLNFTFYGNVAGSPASISNTASLTLPADTTIEDPVPGNNTATDTDLLDGLFANGFEDPQVRAPAGSQRIPALALARTLGDEASIVLRLTDARGEAVRVYARLHEATIQYAVAGRGANGLLRLGAWTALPGEPTLSWTARQVADGWVVETVELR